MALETAHKKDVHHRCTIVRLAGEWVLWQKGDGLWITRGVCFHQPLATTRSPPRWGRILSSAVLCGEGIILAHHLSVQRQHDTYHHRLLQQVDCNNFTTSAPGAQ